MRKKLSLFLAIILIVSLCVPAVLAAGTTISVSASVNNDSKFITISGYISSGTGKIVTIKVVNPSGNIDFLDQVTSGVGGSYLTTYTLDETVGGTYQVSVGGEGIDTPQTTIFEYIIPEQSPTATPSPVPSEAPSPTPAVTPSPTPISTPFVIASTLKAVDNGQQVTVTINTGNVTDLYAYDLTFQYDTSMFDFVSGRLVAETGGFQLLSQLNDDDRDGKIRILATQIGDIPGVCGENLPLVSFVFKAKTAKGTGQFTILAGAKACGSTEQLTATNEGLQSPVSIINCDMNNDGRVDILDIVRIAKAFGKAYGQPGYDPDLDINKDGVIDIYDMTFVALKVLGN